MTQRELAGAGITFSYLSRLETNTRTPSVKALRLLAPKLGVSAHWLETGRDDPAAQLARLVLEHRGKRLPERALTLARAVLASG